MLTSSIFRNNEEKSRFELLLGNDVAYVQYIGEGDKITLFNTEIPKSIAKIDDSAQYLINKIVHSCAESKIELEIYCPFAKAIIDKSVD